jgi:hypothetical protein
MSSYVVCLSNNSFYHNINIKIKVFKKVHLGISTVYDFEIIRRKKNSGIQFMYVGIYLFIYLFVYLFIYLCVVYLNTSVNVFVYIWPNVRIVSKKYTENLL